MIYMFVNDLHVVSNKNIDLKYIKVYNTLGTYTSPVPFNIIMIYDFYLFSWETNMYLF